MYDGSKQHDDFSRVGAALSIHFLNLWTFGGCLGDGVEKLMDAKLKFSVFLVILKSLMFSL